MSCMKYRPITRILSLAAALFILTACTPHNLPDGWYTTSGEGPDTRIGPSIVTCSDFAALHLDSLPSGEGTFIYQITGTVKPEKQKRWTAATRKAVGRHIVFLYEGNVLAAPRINMPIDRGTFAISAPAIGSLLFASIDNSFSRLSTPVMFFLPILSSISPFYFSYKPSLHPKAPEILLQYSVRFYEDFSEKYP